MTHDELVEKMIAAWFGAEEGVGPQVAEMTQEQRMSAVLRVCVKELLGNLTSEERDRNFAQGTSLDISEFIVFRRARYSPPKPKTAQEKIEAILDATFIGPGTNSIVAAKIVAELNLKEQK